MLDIEKISSLANKLKKQRESKNLSLERAHKETKIHLNILKAFEEGNFSILSPTYIRGFLKRYAEYLGLDSQEILNEYTANYPQHTEQVIFLQKNKQIRRIAPKNFGKFIKPVSIGVLGLILVIFLSSVGIHFIGSARSKMRQPQKAKKVAATKKSKQTPKKESSGLTIKTQPKQMPETKKIIIAKNNPIILTLIATGDSWLEVTVDGSEIFKGILKKGSKETWQATDMIELSCGRAHYLEVELDQKPYGKLGDGVMKNIVVTKEGVRVKK